MGFIFLKTQEDRVKILYEALKEVPGVEELQENLAQASESERVTEELKLNILNNKLEREMNEK